jgi:cytochrome c oxidase subunit II
VRKRLIRLIPLIATFIFLATIVALGDEQPLAIVASNWKFAPNTITLKVGVPQTLRLSSVEGVHGLQSDALGISQTLIIPGKETDVTVTPKKAGTYVLHCSVPCGTGHETMTLTVKVEP